MAVLTHDGKVIGEGAAPSYTKSEIDQKVSTLQKMIAPIQSNLTASKAYAVSEQFVYNGLLYKATAAIAQGGTITIDGNCELADSVTGQIKTLSDAFNGIHFPSGNLSSPITNLNTHSGETLSLVPKAGFYHINLIPTSDSTCSLLLLQGGGGVYNFVSSRGAMDSRIVYLNTNSYKIITTGSIDRCYLYN